MKRIDPNTEPCETVASRVCDGLQPEHEIVKVLSDRYEENQERTLPRRPNHKDKRCSIMQNGVVYRVKSYGEVNKGQPIRADRNVTMNCTVVCSI